MNVFISFPLMYYVFTFYNHILFSGSSYQLQAVHQHKCVFISKSWSFEFQHLTVFQGHVKVRTLAITLGIQGR